MKVILFTINFMILQQHVKQLIRNEFTIIYNFNKDQNTSLYVGKILVSIAKEM